MIRVSKVKDLKQLSEVRKCNSTTQKGKSRILTFHWCSIAGPGSGLEPSPADWNSTNNSTLPVDWVRRDGEEEDERQYHGPLVSTTGGRPSNTPLIPVVGHLGSLLWMCEHAASIKDDSSRSALSARGCHAERSRSNGFWGYTWGFLKIGEGWKCCLLMEELWWIVVDKEERGSLNSKLSSCDAYRNNSIWLPDFTQKWVC